jgi:hypothetical protein
MLFMQGMDEIAHLRAKDALDGLPSVVPPPSNAAVSLRGDPG